MRSTLITAGEGVRSRTDRNPEPLCPRYWFESLSLHPSAKLRKFAALNHVPSLAKHNPSFVSTKTFWLGAYVIRLLQQLEWCSAAVSLAILKFLSGFFTQVFEAC